MLRGLSDDERVVLLTELVVCDVCSLEALCKLDDPCTLRILAQITDRKEPSWLRSEFSSLNIPITQFVPGKSSNSYNK